MHAYRSAQSILVFSLDVWTVSTQPCARALVDFLPEMLSTVDAMNALSLQ